MNFNPSFLRKDVNSNPTLALHNSFDKLHVDNELPFGETPLVDQEQSHNSSDFLQAILESVEPIPQENACLVPNNSTVKPCELKNRHSQAVNLDPTKGVLDQSLIAKWATTPILTPTGLTIHPHLCLPLRLWIRSRCWLQFVSLHHLLLTKTPLINLCLQLFLCRSL